MLTTIEKEKDDAKIIKKTIYVALGLGSLTLGIYLFSPSWVRQLWLIELPERSQLAPAQAPLVTVPGPTMIPVKRV